MTDVWHREIAKKGFFPPPIDGFYDHDSTLNGLFRYFREKSVNKIEVERLRKLTAEADGIEMDNAMKRGDLLSPDEIDRLLESVCVTVREKMLASSMSDAEKNAICIELGKLETYEIGEGEDVPA